MPITTLPSAPSRAVPATFSTLADAFIGALSTFVTEANALEVAVSADEVSTAADVVSTAAAVVLAEAAADTAESAANYKGDWAAQTGAAAVPYMVSSLGRYWQLVSDLANVTTKTPGTDPEWLEVGNITKADSRAASNPKAMAQGVKMTYVVSGSTGIQVADNININFGTGNFTIVWRGSLPDWTPGATTYLLLKNGTGIFALYLTSANKYFVYLTGATGAVQFQSTSANTFIDNTSHELVSAVTKETAGADGSLALYVDGVLVQTFVITANTIGNIVATESLNLLGNISGGGSRRFAGTISFAATYNRALTAAEVLDLYRNGVNFADKWGSQTELFITATDRTFTGGVTNWENVDFGTTWDETTDLSIVASATGQYGKITFTNIGTALVHGKRYRLTYDYAVTTAGFEFKLGGTTGQTLGDAIVGTGQTIEFTAVEDYATTDFLGIYSKTAAAAAGDFDNFSLVEIGATLALEPEGMQPNPGQWLDSSTNKLHAMQPATGSSLVRAKREFEVRWTNTWAGTHEAQYIGGVNQAVLPVGCYITNIIGVVAGGTIQDIIVGDGSDTDHWVAITTGLAAGTTSFTIANPISDGTNYKLVVDPDVNMTGSIAWTIKGIVL